MTDALSQSKPETTSIGPVSTTETTKSVAYYKRHFINAIENSNKSDLEKKQLLKRLAGITHLHNIIESQCTMKIDKRLVRIEYPGEVRNIDKAIRTLGGIESIETCVAHHSQKLQLNFHPMNRYNKPCAADRVFKPGILIRVKKSSLVPLPGCSKDDVKPEYEVLGVSAMNFTFNKLCDFQYLPLIANQPETKESKTDFIYHTILPKKIPDDKWLRSDEAKHMELFMLPVRFSLHDNCQQKLAVESDDQAEFALKSKAKKAAKKRKRVSRIFGNNRAQVSHFVNFTQQEIPTEPLEVLHKLLESRCLGEQIARVKQLFDERPIWTKSAVRYNIGLSLEQCKLALPMVAYHFKNGPWRACWVKFGYDPRLNPKARIYQTLDYRIRTAESTKLKVKAKRSYTAKSALNFCPGHVQMISLKDTVSGKPKLDLHERCYVLRPNTIPPARQMFYQLCDIHLPEIKDRLSRLPLNANSYCDPKFGWFPKSFMDDCREIANNYVLQAVQKELLEDDKVLQEKALRQEQKDKDKPLTALDYCSQMLNKVKQGVYKSVDLNLAGRARKLENINLDDIEMIDLSDEEEELTVGDIIQDSIPEKMVDDEEEEDDDDEDDVDSDDQLSDEPDIDMEVVDEINRIITKSENVS